jgi:hypothetical protein
LRNFICICLFFFGFLSRAQLLLPTTESAFETQQNFNPSFIKAKGIRKISFEIIDKKDFEVAIDKSLTENYEFNENGLLTRFYLTDIVSTSKREGFKIGKNGRRIPYLFTEFVYDTISTSYFYSGEKVILKRFHDGLNYFESRYYRYDSLGNLTKEQRYKEINNSRDRSVFILGNQVLLSEDSFQYQKFSSGQLKCTFLNNENRPYKERITNYDSSGKAKLVSEHYTAASWIMQENRFEYKNNRLVKAEFEGNANHNILLKNTYEYDEMNELYTEKKYKNDILLREISYVTLKSDSLLNSIVIRDPINKTIRIIKLKYDIGMLGKRGN